MKVSALIKELHINEKDVIGDMNRIIVEAVSLSLADTNQLTFCKTYEMLKSSGVKGCAIIISRIISNSLPSDNTYIFVDNPKLVFIRALVLLYPSTTKPGIDKRAYIDNSSYVASTAYVGPFVYVGPECFIGENVEIHTNVSIHRNSVIEENVLVLPGTVIGSDGFGYERNEKNELEKFLHIGGVHIGKNVEIGSNVNINRGALSNTEICEGTKIDSLVHIAHNCKIGKHCSIASGCAFGGSVTLGDHVTFATGVVTRNGIQIGKNVFVGLGAVVTKDISDNMTIMGVPAREINEFKKHLKFMRDNVQ